MNSGSTAVLTRDLRLRYRLTIELETQQKPPGYLSELPPHTMAEDVFILANRQSFAKTPFIG
jgi:hypothetical protein